MKKSLTTKFIIVFLMLVVVMFGIRASSQQNQLQKQSLEKSEVAVLLTGNDAAFGYSCGVLTTQQAKDLLKDSSDLKRSFGQGPTDTVQATKAPQEKLFWADSCRYEDTSNNARYIELYITTFQSDEAAFEAFPDFLQVVNDAVELPSVEYGQQLLYDGGVYYLLNDNKIIQVAASNGSLQELERFSRLVFDNIVKNL